MGTRRGRSVRVDGALFEAAQAAGRESQRSTAAQLNYWARLGRALEAVRGVASGDIDRTLAGEHNPDGGPDLDSPEGDRTTSADPGRPPPQDGGPGDA